MLAGPCDPRSAGARVQIYRGRTYVTSARVGANGRFRARLLLRLPGPYHARYGAARSSERLVRLRPTIEAPLLGTAVVGTTLTLRPRLVPARAGSLSVRVFLDGHRSSCAAGRVKLPTGRPGTAGRACLPATSRLRAGPQGRRRPGRPAVARRPARAARASSPSSGGWRELHYALEGIDGYYGTDTFEAVLAFQKVNGLPRTGRVEPWLWRRLATPACPARTAAATTSRSTRRGRC